MALALFPFQYRHAAADVLLRHRHPGPAFIVDAGALRLVGLLAYLLDLCDMRSRDLHRRLAPVMLDHAPYAARGQGVQAALLDVAFPACVMSVACWYPIVPPLWHLGADAAIVGYVVVLADVDPVFF